MYAKYNLIEQPDANQIKVDELELQGSPDKTAHLENLVLEWFQLENLPKLDHRFIQTTIRYSKHNLERSKRKLYNYLLTKTVHRQYFEHLTSKEVEDQNQKLEYGYAPKLTVQGCRVLYFRLIVPEIEVTAMQRCIIKIMDGLHISEVPGNAKILVIDAGNVSAALVPKLFKFFKINTEILLSSYALRIRQVHIVNVAPSVDAILNLVKPLMNKKVQKNVFCHKDGTGLLKHLPEYCVPALYGGTGGDLTVWSNSFKQFLHDLHPWYLEQERIVLQDLQKVDLPQEMMGSFRQLEID